MHKNLKVKSKKILKANISIDLVYLYFPSIFF